MEYRRKMNTIKILKIVALSASLVMTSSAFARGTATGTIEKITTAGSVTNVFLSSDIVAVNGETVPACSTRDDFFTLAADQKNQLAVLLTALALESSVKINGNGQCTNKSNAEDIASIQVVK